MLKKISAVLLAAAVCLGFAGCSSASGKYDAVRKAQEAVSEWNSCKALVTASYDNSVKSSRMVNEFTFRLTSSGNYEYCQTQYDQNNKAVYCEYSDGETAEQWLIGKGWSGIGATVYNQKSPHRYIQLLSTTFDKKAVGEVTVEEQEKNIRYTIALNAEHLNETTYKDADIEVLEETVIATLNEAGELVSYEDEAKVFDKQSEQECVYSLNIQLSEINTVAEILKPELRDYSK